MHTILSRANIVSKCCSKGSFLLLLVLATATYGQVKYDTSWASLDSRPIPSWYEDAKFGIFIHWGIYSVPAWAPTDVSTYEQYAEWYWKKLVDSTTETHTQFVEFHNRVYGADVKYEDFASWFDCKLFDPIQWSATIANSGAKYVVLTSKHHDGFALWPSAESSGWNSNDTGPQRDLAMEISEAIRKKNIRMGFYYSLYEWFNPLYKQNFTAYRQYMHAQLKDLVTRYNPDIVWADGEWDHSSTEWRSKEFLAWLFNESAVRSTVVVNDRWGNDTRSKHGTFFSTEYDLINNDDVSGSTINHAWEECRGIGGSFGYNRNEHLEDYATSTELIHLLVDKVSRGGNLLLNIGPTADGRIPVIMQQRLADLGKWLKLNGDAIYGTRRIPPNTLMSKDTNTFFTSKNKDAYIIKTHYPQQSSLEITVDQIPSSVTLLESGQKLNFTKKGKRIIIDLSSMKLNNTTSDHAWVLKVEGCL